MRRVETFRWFLPPKPWAGLRAQPYLSRWHMDCEEAMRHGALRPEPTSLRVIEQPESEEERKAHAATVDTAAFQKATPALTPNQRLALARGPAGFDRLQPGIVRAAAALVDAGWKPRHQRGVIATLDRPRAGRWQVTEPATWAAMCMLSLQRAGLVREMRGAD